MHRLSSISAMRTCTMTLRPFRVAAVLSPSSSLPSQHSSCQHHRQSLLHSPFISYRYLGTGARGSRGLGWYKKYREGRGGRHLQGPQFDRESREVLAEMNDKIFRMGSTWYTLQLCEMRSPLMDQDTEKSEASADQNAVDGGTDGTVDGSHGNHDDNPVNSIASKLQGLVFHDLHLELATAAMPLTTTNFDLLSHLYEGTIVHRIEKKVGLCLGDIRMTQGRSGYCHESLSNTGKLPTTEPLVLSHLAGIVSMVSTGVDKVDSRFMLCTHDSYQLDGRFVAFGRLSEESLAICQGIEKSQFTTRGLPNVEIRVTSCRPLEEKEIPTTADSREASNKQVA